MIIPSSVPNQEWVKFPNNWDLQQQNGNILRKGWIRSPEFFPEAPGIPGGFTGGGFFHGIVILHHGVLDDVADLLPWLQLLLLAFHEKIRVCHPGKRGNGNRQREIPGIWFPKGRNRNGFGLVLVPKTPRKKKKLRFKILKCFFPRKSMEFGMKIAGIDSELGYFASPTEEFQVISLVFPGKSVGLS